MIDIVEKFKYDAHWINAESIMYWFVGPKETLKDFYLDYPEADSCTIGIELSNDNINDIYEILLSPAKDGSDYDWNPIDLRNDTIEGLLNKAPHFSGHKEVNK